MDEPSSEQQKLVEDNLLEECLIKDSLDSNLSKPLDNVESGTSASEVPPSLQQDTMEVDSQLEESALNSFADSQKELDLEKLSEIHDENELDLPIGKDSDIPIDKNDDKIINDSDQSKSLFQDNIESKLTETPPLLLLETKSKSLDEDSVFSTDMSTMPDQLLAEPSRSEELDERTEQDIASNIEEQLREFEGSEDEMSLPKDLDIDSQPSQTPIAQITRPEDIFGDDFNSDSATNRVTPMVDENIEQKEQEIAEDIVEPVCIPEEPQVSLEDVKKNEEIINLEEQVDLNTSDVPSEIQQPQEKDDIFTSDVPSEIQQPQEKDDIFTSDVPSEIQQPQEKDDILDCQEKPTEEEKFEKSEQYDNNSGDMESLLLEEEQEQSESANIVEETINKSTNDPSQDNEGSESRNIDFEDVEMQSIVDSKNTSTNEGADDPFDKIEATVEASTSGDQEKDVIPSGDGEFEKESFDTTEEPSENANIQLNDEKLHADKDISLEDASIEDKLDAIFNEGEEKSSTEVEANETKELEAEEVDEIEKVTENVNTEEDKIDNIEDLLESEKDTPQETADSEVELLEPMQVNETDQANTDVPSKEDSNQAEKDKSDCLKETEKDETCPEDTNQEMSVEEEQERQRETPAEEIEKVNEKEGDVQMENASENIESKEDSLESTKQKETVSLDDAKAKEDASNSTQEKKKRTKEKTARDVKESEESDVCLLPDSEKELTGAEKEKAILARENAEKEAEKIEKEKTKRHSTRHSTPEDTVIEEEAPEPQIDEGIDLDENEIKEISTNVKDDRCFKCRKIKSCKYKFLRDSEVKYLCDLKCVHSFRATSKETFTLTARKIVISSIFGFMSNCLRCRAKRSCCYRFKNTDTGNFHYLCSTACMNSFIGKNVEKYIVRRKKYIVEEMAQDTTATCIHCKESKGCRYQFKQDDDTLYICNEDCFNLLSKEEPERYRLKRRSVRVRELGGQPPPVHSEAETKIVARTQEEADAARIERETSFIRHCAHCFATIEASDAILQWETADFCNEQCLGKYQNVIGSKCHMCKSQVPLQSLGKYCVRFGFEIRQFCCTSCLDRFKKGLKVCSYCQKDISKDKEGFLAPVGDKGQFKDFCSQGCMTHYDEICNPKKKSNTGICAVCSNEKPIRVEISLDNRDHNFCSNPCFSAFKFVNNLFPDQCGMCLKYFERKSVESYTLYNEKNPKVFCCKVCMNIFIALTRKIVACQWCKVKKYNFDMIQKQCGAQTIMLCSVNCLTLYGVSLNAVSMKQLNCDQCKRQACPQYHLTMSDASLRNFCTYQCVMLFQNQFGRLAWPLSNSGVKDSSSKKNAPFPTGVPKRVKVKAIQAVEKESEKSVSIPVISNVESLADSTNSSGVVIKRTLRKGRSRQAATSAQSEGVQADVVGATEETETPSSVLPTSKSDDKTSQPKEINLNLTPVVAVKKLPLNTISIHTQTKAPTRRSFGVNTVDADTKSTKRSFGVNTVETEPAKLPKTFGKQDKSDKTKHEFKTCMISVAPPPPKVANKQTMCKPASISKGNNCRPHPCSVQCQTDEEVGRKIIIPIPVPIYVPQPMYMYSAPFPVPVPIPLPIPVPIFIPTTRNTAEGIMKEIKKIQEKTPTDPFEAELLMMAEMVAEEKKNESDSDSELGATQSKREKSPAKVEVFQSETLEPSNSFGEDVLQMALKMATECDEPTVDLESAMTTTTISTPEQQTQQQQHISVAEDALVEDSNEIHQMIMIDGQRQIIRGRKRAISPASTSPSQTQLPIQAPAQRNNRVLPVPPPIKRPRRSDVHVIAQQEPILKEIVEKPDANMCLKYTFGVNAWKQWVMTKNSDLEKSTFKRKPFKSELLQLTADELNYSLCLFVKEVRKPNGSEYAPDTIYYLVLGIQQYLYENGRIDNIFTDTYYERFTECLDEVAKKFSILYNDSQYIVTRVEEEHLWECKQLGAHSPHVLLSTLMFFNTKHFNLTTVEEHMQLSFSHIMKHWKRSPSGSKTPGQRNVLLRFYPPQSGPDANPRKKKVYEQQENEENPLRCPVKLYEFYLSKCPESVKTRNDVFYLQPERSCVPDSPVWYSTQALSREALSKMLHRVKMVKEINIALLTS